MLLFMATCSAASSTAVSAAVGSSSYSSLGGSVCCTCTAVGASGFSGAGGAACSLGFRVDELVLVLVFMLPLLGVVACFGSGVEMSGSIVSTNVHWRPRGASVKETPKS